MTPELRAVAAAAVADVPEEAFEAVSAVAEDIACPILASEVASVAVVVLSVGLIEASVAVVTVIADAVAVEIADLLVGREEHHKLCQQIKH